MIIDDAAFQRSIYDILVLRDYAIQSGRTVSDGLMQRIEGLSDVPPGDRDSYVVQLMREFSALLSPTPIANVLRDKRGELLSKRNGLLRGGILSIIVLIAVTIAAMYIRRELLGTAACDSAPCDTIFSILVIGYGASLGLIGSIAYELIHSSGIVRSDDYGEYDDYRGDARHVLGVTMGWIFSITVSLQALSRIFSIDSSGDTDPGFSDYVIILLPFLLGYSSDLVTTIIDRLIDGVRVLFGMPQRNPPIDPAPPSPPGKMEISEGPAVDLTAGPMKRFMSGR